MNPTSIHEVTGLIPGPAQWVKGASVAMSCGVGHRHGSDPMWLWPAAVALIQSLAWEFWYALGAALKTKKKKKIPPSTAFYTHICTYVYVFKIHMSFLKFSNVKG